MINLKPKLQINVRRFNSLIFLACLLTGCAQYTYKNFGQGRNLHARLDNGQTFLVIETTSYFACDQQATAMDRRWFDYGGGNGKSIICSDDPPPAYMKSSTVLSMNDGLLAFHMPTLDICKSVFDVLVPVGSAKIIQPCGPYKPLEEEL